MTPKTIKLTLPKPHAAQARVFEEARRFNAVVCGRRWGKSTAAIDRLIKPALQGKPVAWCAPVFRQLQEVWRQLQDVLTPVIQTKNADEHRLALSTGGTIHCFSLDSFDVIRGRKLACVVIDEAGSVPNLQTAWMTAIRPCLSDLKGEAWFLGTPRGFNYFQTLYSYGQDPTKPDWMSWQMSTTANPFIDPAEVEAARADMTEGFFNQEFLALFVDSADGIFRFVNAAVRPELTNARPERKRRYAFGIDFGRSNDYTAIVVLDLEARTVVHIDRFTGLEYAVQLGRLKALHDHWKPVQIVAEANNFGSAMIEALRRDGIRVTSFDTSNASKAAIVENLALAFERRSIGIPDDKILMGNLSASRQVRRLPG